MYTFCFPPIGFFLRVKKNVGCHCCIQTPTQNLCPNILSVITGQKRTIFSSDIKHVKLDVWILRPFNEKKIMIEILWSNLKSIQKIGPEIYVF